MSEPKKVGGPTYFYNGVSHYEIPVTVTPATDQPSREDFRKNEMQTALDNFKKDCASSKARNNPEQPETQEEPVSPAENDSQDGSEQEDAETDSQTVRKRGRPRKDS